MEETICSFGTFASPVKANSRLGDFKILSRLGEGAFSTVYKVERAADKRIYALKKVRLSRLSEKEKANALNEIRILASIRSRHVIEYRDSFFDESSDSLCIVMEYAGEGDLLSKLNQFRALNTLHKNQLEEHRSLHQQQHHEIDDHDSHFNNNNNIFASSETESQILTSEEGSRNRGEAELQSQEAVLKFHMEEQQVWEYLRQITEGLRCLHAMGILHRDLKCANLFIGCNNQVKIGDLNVSIVTHPSKSIAKSQTGTPYYTAPEIWRGHAYSSKSDIWSLGCIVYELCAQNPPFRATSIEGLFMRILKGEFTRIPSEFYSQELAALVTRCLDQQPENRPTCDEILAAIPPSTIQHHHHQQYHQSHNSNNCQTNAQIAARTSLPRTPNRNNSSNSKKQYLIDTINVPSNMKRLSDLLPQANYEDTASATTQLLPPQVPLITEFNETFSGKGDMGILFSAMPSNTAQIPNNKFTPAIPTDDSMKVFSLLGIIMPLAPHGAVTATATATDTADATNNLIHLNGVITPKIEVPETIVSIENPGMLAQPTILEYEENEDGRSNNQNTFRFQNRRGGGVYHDLVNDSPIRMNLQKVPMDSKQQQPQTIKQNQNNNNNNNNQHHNLLQLHPTQRVSQVISSSTEQSNKGIVVSGTAAMAQGQVGDISFKKKKNTFHLNLPTNVNSNNAIEQQQLQQYQPSKAANAHGLNSNYVVNFNTAPPVLEESTVPPAQLLSRNVQPRSSRHNYQQQNYELEQSGTFSGYSFTEEGGINQPRESVGRGATTTTTSTANTNLTLYNQSRRYLTRGARSLSNYIKSEPNVSSSSSKSPPSQCNNSYSPSAIPNPANISQKQHSSISSNISRTQRTLTTPAGNLSSGIFAGTSKSTSMKRTAPSYSEYASVPQQKSVCSPATPSARIAQQQQSFTQVVKRYYPKATVKNGVVIGLENDSNRHSQSTASHLSSASNSSSNPNHIMSNNSIPLTSRSSYGFSSVYPQTNRTTQQQQQQQQQQQNNNTPYTSAQMAAELIAAATNITSSNPPLSSRMPSTATTINTMLQRNTQQQHSLLANQNQTTAGLQSQSTSSPQIAFYSQNNNKENSVHHMNSVYGKTSQQPQTNVGTVNKNNWKNEGVSAASFNSNKVASGNCSNSYNSNNQHNNQVLASNNYHLLLKRFGGNSVTPTTSFNRQPSPPRGNLQKNSQQSMNTTTGNTHANRTNNNSNFQQNIFINQNQADHLYNQLGYHQPLPAQSNSATGMVNNLFQQLPTHSSSLPSRIVGLPTTSVSATLLQQHHKIQSTHHAFLPIHVLSELPPATNSFERNGNHAQYGFR